MSRREWIVCERTGRWAAALRVAIGRAECSGRDRPRLFEVRQLDQLTARLDERPHVMVLVEVQRAFFSDVLRWLSEAERRHPDARCAALLDVDLTSPKSGQRERRRLERQQVVDALRNAGAADVVSSPRKLAAIFALDRQHAALSAIRRNSQMREMAPADWAWSVLPWQDE